MHASAKSQSQILAQRPPSPKSSHAINSQPLNIAILQDHLRNGGTEQQTLAIARGLANAGHHVHLVVFRRGGSLDPQAIQSSPFTLHYLNQGLLKTDWFAPGLKKLLARLAPDVVLPMGRMANCHAGLLAHDKRRPYKLLATFRTGRAIPYLYRHALQHADQLVANSQEALRRLASEYRIHRPDTSSVIYNGCIRDFETQIPNVGSGLAPRSPNQVPPPLHLVSVSMFRPQKQQIRLVRICSQLPETLDWKLTLAGDGPTRAACQAEAQKLRIADRIHFPGLLKDPRSLYFDADIAVHTSDQESLPNFLVEAQMSGLPVVAYDVNGVSETFVDNETGYLIPHRDETAFLTALEKLATDPALRLQFGDAARLHARKNFSLKSQTTAYIRLLNSLTTS
ncbi:glycosyltransferase [Pelagicoccus enzymogenes]|uniref:glycosyltransferase n=1 Tax=Pelagicoccus enzymogenes TaxID=2773457 RepID=UPI00280E4791|nr:glycosyltransferase [Pelagicoccus enzymogenes]MDQ8200991.1 glycosyltransferase [Pelagicoccus enzymogenes]